MQPMAVRCPPRWRLPVGTTRALGSLRKVKNLPGLVAIALAAAVASASGLAVAAGGSGTYPLEWAHSGEVLEYRSCGCADSCWVARVKNVRTQQTLAQLRCDCEKAYAVVGARGREQLYAPSCSAFEGDNDKPQAIRQALEELVRR